MDKRHGLAIRLGRLGGSVVRVCADLASSRARFELIGLLAWVLSRHRAVRILATSNHVTEVMAILRSLLEGALILLYVVEDKNEQTFSARWEEYEDWRQVKMQQNTDDSVAGLAAMPAIFGDKLYSAGYRQRVSENYQRVLAKHASAPSTVKRLHRSVFLDKATSQRVADVNGLGGVYRHIYAEASASLHAADLSDFVQAGDDGGHIQLRFAGHQAWWPLLLANMIVVMALRRVVGFFGVEARYLARLKDYLRSLTRASETEA